MKRRILLSLFIASSFISQTTVGQPPTPAYSESPLLAEAERLRTNPDRVNYEILKFLLENKRMEFDDYVKAKDELYKVIQSMYFIRALERSALLANRKELVDILNNYALKGFDETGTKKTCIEFEQKYFELNGEFPSLAPVDSLAITQRLLNRSQLR